MAPLWQTFARPGSLAEALQILVSAPGPACPIAGGTDLILELRQGRRPPVHTLVDVTGIPELTALEIRGPELYIGAAVPVSRIIESSLVQMHAYALAEACDRIGGPQVRNQATLGGNVAHALPAADGAIALLALDAVAVVASLVVGASAPENPGITLKKIPLLELYLGPGKTALSAGQLLVGFYLPLAGTGEGAAFTRVMRSQGVGLAVVNLAVWLKRKQGVISACRIALGPAGPIPQRALKAEKALCGRPPEAEALAAAGAALLEEVHFRTSSQRATAGYRRHLAGKLLAEAVGKAWERAV